MWETLGLYNERRKGDMSVTDKILLNRRLLVCANKMLKEQVLDIELESTDKINNFLDRIQRVVFDSYRYLSLYIKYLLPIHELPE